jgi:CcmD family protein
MSLTTWREKLGALGVVAFQGDGFVPIRPDQMQEALPAAPLVFAAYAVAWLAVFFYAFTIWRRLSKVEHELTEVQSKIKGGARR